MRRTPQRASMSADSSRRFLSLAAIYAINQISLFVTFKVSAEIASPVAHVALPSPAAGVRPRWPLCVVSRKSQWS